MDTSGGIRFPAIILILFIALLISMVALPPGGNNARAASGWQAQTSGVSGIIHSVSAVSKTTAWAGGADGILKTTDGGTTWKKQTLPDAAFCVYAVNAQVAWAAGYGGAYRTTNGGATWKLVLKNDPPTIHAATYSVAVTATDSNTAWVCNLAWFQIWTPMPEYSWGIIKTENGGTTWSEPQTGGAGIAKPGLCAVDPSTAWAAANDDQTHALITKTNLGAGWNTQFNPTTANNSQLTSIDASDADNAWTVGLFYEPVTGVILHTSDGGMGWQSQDSHTDQYLYSVSAVDTKTAWAAGFGGTIVKTVDGQTWGPQASGITTNLLSVSAVDANTAWAVGDGGVILHTVDGGGGPVSVPNLQSVTVNEGSSEMILHGSGFGAAQGSTQIEMGKVTWDYGYPVAGTQSSVNSTAWSDTEIRCVPPTTDPGVYEIVLKTGNLTSSRCFFSIGQCSAVTSVAPYYGANNATLSVAMTGYGFNAPNFAVQVSNQTTSIPVTNVVVASPTQLTCKLNLTGQPAGRYDVRVGGDYPVTAFLNGFSVVAPKVSKITPSSGTNLSAVSVSISGVGFLPGATVRIERGTTVINATTVSVKSGSLITCSLNLQGKTTGKYDVVVHNPDTQELRLAGGFTVTNACGQGAGASISVFAGLLGLLSVAGLGWRKKRLIG